MLFNADYEAKLYLNAIVILKQNNNKAAHLGKI